MDKLFWGFFLLFLDFNLNFGAASLNLLPEWVGYILLYLACTELLGESDIFRKPQPFCVGLAIYTGILWLLDLLGIAINLVIIGLVLSLAAACLQLYVTMLIIDAIANMEMRRNAELGCARLRSVWKVIAVCTIATVVLSLVPVLALVCAVVAGVSGIVFLFAVHKTRKAYRQMLSDYGQGF